MTKRVSLYTQGQDAVLVRSTGLALGAARVLAGNKSVRDNAHKL